MELSNIGLIGLAVMGENLAMNMESKGFKVSVFNRTAGKTERFVHGRARGRRIFAAYSLEELVDSLEKPRKIMFMVRAGEAVDSLIQALLPLLDPGDILIDGGNSLFSDTERRWKNLDIQGIGYIGAGISGGEEGALNGPSIMPGGSEEAWPEVSGIFQKICAQVGGEPCCDWLGRGGAGHFVKMVHNGIEYGDMQLICEAYHLMKSLLSMDTDAMSKAFKDYGKTDLNSYLIEITGKILSVKDKDGKALLDSIQDAAEQKGTGKWTGITALSHSVPLTLIGEAVFARFLSALKDERVRASSIYSHKAEPFKGDGEAFLLDLRQALLASKIVSYAQGYSLMRTAASEHNWDLNYGTIAMLWRGGCIIRSSFLMKIKQAFSRNPDLQNLLLDPWFENTLKGLLPSWRRVCVAAIEHEIPIPAMTSGLEYFDGYTCGRSPANLLQAQRDYFGAHMYERVDAPRGQFFHTDWTGKGGCTHSSVYRV